MNLLTKRVDTASPSIANIIKAIDPSGRRRVLNLVGYKLLNMTRANFGPSGEYHGNNWPKLSKAYAKKIGSSTPTLKRTGALQNSIKLGPIRNNWFEIYTNSPYAAAHLLGNSRKHIPQRIFFPIEQVGSNYWRPPIKVEKELVVEIGKALYLLSNGALPRLSSTVQRSLPQYGNVKIPGQSPMPDGAV